jgi:hypothetical protein
VQDEKHVHHRRNRATIGRRFRCAGDLLSRPPRNQPTTTRIRSLPPASPADSFSALADARGQPTGDSLPGKDAPTGFSES